MNTYNFVVKLTIDASNAEAREYLTSAISSWGGSFDRSHPFFPGNFEVAIKRQHTSPINACYTRSVEVLNAEIKRLKEQLRKCTEECSVLLRERDEALKASEGYRGYAAEKSNQYVQACRERDEACAQIEAAQNVMRGCEHDGGFDREAGPIGCMLFDKCVCLGVWSSMNLALKKEPTND